MAQQTKRKPVRLVKEAAPDPSILAQIDRIEDSDDCGGMDLETLAQYMRSLLPGHVHGYAPSYPADRPTDCLPGSGFPAYQDEPLQGKARVMAERASRGMSLFHEDDARGLPDTPTREDED